MRIKLFIVGVLCTFSCVTHAQIDGYNSILKRDTTQGIRLTFNYLASSIINHSSESALVQVMRHEYGKKESVKQSGRIDHDQLNYAVELGAERFTKEGFYFQSRLGFRTFKEFMDFSYRNPDPGFTGERYWAHIEQSFINVGVSAGVDILNYAELQQGVRLCLHMGIDSRMSLNQRMWGRAAAPNFSSDRELRYLDYWDNYYLGGQFLDLVIGARLHIGYLSFEIKTQQFNKNRFTPISASGKTAKDVCRILSLSAGVSI